MSLLGLATIIMAVATLIIIPGTIRFLPMDYFCPRKKSVTAITGPISFLLLFFKNVFGLILVLAGIAMLVLPGQGLLTILIGVGLLDFPGKRRLEMRLVRHKNIRMGLDWIRQKVGQPPFTWD